MVAHVRPRTCRATPIVLLVQPERDERDMYAEFLSYRGFLPVCVQQATDALRVAPRADIVVTGLLLPGPLDGFMLIEALKRDAATRDIPVVVLTACAWTAEETRARDAGCDVFLSKPCHPKTLVRELRRVLARRFAHANVLGVAQRQSG